VTFVFKGRGFGHGVGLSQWGAQGMALTGSSAEQILAHYYRGTAVTAVGGD
jgi:stage II sporulation protein D